MASLYELLTPLLTCNNLPEEGTNKFENTEPQPKQDTPEPTKKTKQTLKSTSKQPLKRKHKGSTKDTKAKKTKRKKQKLEKVTKKSFL